MKIKKIFATVVSAIGLSAAVSRITQPAPIQTVNAKVKTTHTIPKKFRGTWYEYGSKNIWSVYKFTKKTEKFYTTIGSHVSSHKVTVKKYNNNKYLIYIKGTKPVYKSYFSTKTLNYNGKNIKAIAINEKDNPTTTYYLKKKIKKNYHDDSGFY